MYKEKFADWYSQSYINKRYFWVYWLNKIKKHMTKTLDFSRALAKKAKRRHIPESMSPNELHWWVHVATQAAMRMDVPLCHSKCIKYRSLCIQLCACVLLQHTAQGHVKVAVTDACPGEFHPSRSWHYHSLALRYQQLHLINSALGTLQIEKEYEAVVSTSDVNIRYFLNKA